MSNIFDASGDELIQIQACKAPWSIRPGLGFRFAYSSFKSHIECEVLVIATRTKTLPPIKAVLLQLNFPVCLEFRSTYEGCYVCEDSRLAHPGDNDPDAYLQEVMKSWEQSENCPDPGLYHVTNSTWKFSKQISDPQRWNHYLIPIDDGYIEFLANQCIWREFQASEIPAHGIIDGLLEVARGEIAAMG